MRDDDRARVREMREKIDMIETLTLELRSLGEDVPTIDRNTESLLSVIHALKFGLPSVASTEAPAPDDER